MKTPAKNAPNLIALILLIEARSITGDGTFTIADWETMACLGVPDNQSGFEAAAQILWGLVEEGALDVLTPATATTPVVLRANKRFFQRQDGIMTDGSLQALNN